MATPHKCPVCAGQGCLSKPPDLPGDQHEWTASSTATHTCRACLGARIVWEETFGVERLGAGAVEREVKPVLLLIGKRIGIGRAIQLLEEEMDRLHPGWSTGSRELPEEEI